MNHCTLVAKHSVVNIIRCADRRPVIACPSHDINFIESTFSQQSSVHHAIETHTASNHKVARIRSLAQDARHLERTLLQNFLERRGHIVMILGELSIAFARTAEGSKEFGGT